MAREVEGDRLSLELFCDLDGQWSPSIDVQPGLVQQERDIRSVAPAKPTQHRPPGKQPLDRLWAGKHLGVYVPHSVCL
jgi:hypothetical protein